jgi:hypothetical protein
MFGLPAGGIISATVLYGIRDVNVSSMMFVPGFQV